MDLFGVSLRICLICTAGVFFIANVLFWNNWMERDGTLRRALRSAGNPYRNHGTSRIGSNITALAGATEDAHDEKWARVAAILRDPELLLKNKSRKLSMIPAADAAELQGVITLIDHDLKQFDASVIHPAPNPQSRVYFVYLGYSPIPHDQSIMANEVFGFWSSWQWLFNGVTNFTESFGIDTTDLVQPLKNPREVIGKYRLMVEDLLIVADPRTNRTNIPPGCEVLYPLGAFDAPILDARIAVAERKLRRVAPRCFVVSTFLMNQFHPVLSVYPRLNSNNPLIDATVQRILMNYDLMVRTDADAFVAPGMTYFRPPTWRTVETSTHESNDTSNANAVGDVVGSRRVFDFVFSAGGYCDPLSDPIREEYRKALGLRSGGVLNVGEAFYGRPVDVISAGRIANQVIGILLHNDPVFQLGIGVWPKWWRGTSLMYSRELAVNHVIQKDAIRLVKNLLDVPTSSSTIVTATAQPVATLHCWHTEHFFSKFHFHSMKYNASEIFSSQEYNFYNSSYYSYTFAEMGRRVRLTLTDFTGREKQEAMKRRVIQEIDGMPRRVYTGGVIGTGTNGTGTNGTGTNSSRGDFDFEVVERDIRNEVHKNIARDQFPFVSAKAKILQMRLFHCSRDYPHAYYETLVRARGYYACCTVPVREEACKVERSSGPINCCSGPKKPCPTNEGYPCEDYKGIEYAVHGN